MSHHVYAPPTAAAAASAKLALQVQRRRCAMIAAILWAQAGPQDPWARFAAARQAAEAAGVATAGVHNALVALYLPAEDAAHKPPTAATLEAEAEAAWEAGRLNEYVRS